MDTLIRRLNLSRRWQPGALARSGTELFGWFLVRAAAQALMVLMLARLLGAANYGTFVAVVAIAATFSAIAGLGLPSVLLRDGSRAPAFLPLLLGISLAATFRAILALSVIAAIVAVVVLPEIDAPTSAICALIFSEIASTCLVELVGRAFQAKQQIRYYGALQTGLPCIRLAALCVLIAVDKESLELWLWTYTIANLVYAIATLRLARNAVRWKFRHGKLWPLTREGIPFATGAASTRLQNEYNKPLLAQVGFSQAGYFNVAQRAVDLVSLPLLALQETLWPRLYRAKNHHRQLLVSGAMLILLSLAGMLVVIGASFVVPELLGEEYRPVAELMILLAGLPVLALVRSLGNFHLIATGRAHLLTLVYIIGAIASLVFATLWIPSYALVGAAWASYAAEVVALTCILILAAATR
jgi:O-antigen/teichoic acid export membrane protein